MFTLLSLTKDCVLVQSGTVTSDHDQLLPQPLILSLQSILISPSPSLPPLTRLHVCLKVGEAIDIDMRSVRVSWFVFSGLDWYACFCCVGVEMLAVMAVVSCTQIGWLKCLIIIIMVGG